MSAAKAGTLVGGRENCILPLKAVLPCGFWHILRFQTPVTPAKGQLTEVSCLLRCGFSHSFTGSVQEVVQWMCRRVTLTRGTRHAGVVVLGGKHSAADLQATASAADPSKTRWLGDGMKRCSTAIPIASWLAGFFRPRISYRGHFLIQTSPMAAWLPGWLSFYSLSATRYSYTLAISPGWLAWLASMLTG